MKTTNYAEMGRKFGMSMLQASVATARWTVALLECDAWGMNDEDWEQAKIRSRRALADAESQLRASAASE